MRTALVLVVGTSRPRDVHRRRRARCAHPDRHHALPDLGPGQRGPADRAAGAAGRLGGPRARDRRPTEGTLTWLAPPPSAAGCRRSPSPAAWPWPVAGSAPRPASALGRARRPGRGLRDRGRLARRRVEELQREDRARQDRDHPAEVGRGLGHRPDQHPRQLLRFARRPGRGDRHEVGVHRHRVDQLPRQRRARAGRAGAVRGGARGRPRGERPGLAAARAHEQHLLVRVTPETQEEYGLESLAEITRSRSRTARSAWRASSATAPTA